MSGTHTTQYVRGLPPRRRDVLAALRDIQAETGGYPHASHLRDAPIEVRLLSRIEVSEDGCWVWMGATRGDKKKPYGTIKIGGRRGKFQAVHRVAYQTFVGEIPDGFTIDHLCFNHRCINPAHLEAVTNAENISRSWRTGQRAPQVPKTHCKHGHPFSGDNLYVNAKGHRQCRACWRRRGLLAFYRRKERLCAS